MPAPILVAIMAETAADRTALLVERPGPYPDGTICIVRSTRKIYFWAGGSWLWVN